MDLRIRTALTAVILIFCALAPAHALDPGYEIQFGAFLIQDNAERVKTDLMEMVPGVYVKKIDTDKNRILYTVRVGPFFDHGTAVSRMEAFQEKDPYLTALVVKSTPSAPGAEPVLSIPAEASPAETVPADSDPAKPDLSKPAPSSSDPLAETETLPETEAGAEVTPRETAAAVLETPEEPSASGQEPPEEPAFLETTPEPDESGPAWADQGTAAAWGQEDTSDGGESMSPGSGFDLPDSPAPPTPEMSSLKAELDELKAQVKAMAEAEEIRGTLAEQDEEKEDRSDDILDAAGRNYTLMRTGAFGFEYKLDYSYYDYDTIKESNVIEHNSNHSLTNTFTVEYPMRDNLTLEAAIPLVYKFDAVGRDDSKHVTDFGDVRFGASFQPVKSGGKIPSIILNTSLTCPMGRSPYEVNPDLDLSTGSGGYSLEGSLSMSKVIDPIMVFGTLSYDYKFPIEGLDYKVGSYTLEQYDRGDTIGFSVGLGYSVSYITSVTLGYSYSYSFESRRYYKETSVQEYPTQTSSSLSIGSSWRITNKLRINVSLGIGLANSDYFSLSFRLPMEYGRD